MYNTSGDHVAISRLVIDGAAPGQGRFEDMVLPYDQVLGPLRQSSVIDATAMRFHTFPSDFVGALGSGGVQSRRRVMLVLEGAVRVETLGENKETRTFEPGDVLQMELGATSGHQAQTANGRPFRASIIELEDPTLADPGPVLGGPSGHALPYVRNVTGDDDQSHFQHLSMPYFLPTDRAVGDVCALTSQDTAISKFQYVYAASDLRYDWHNAPQRQVVIPLTGGTQGENGDGSRCVILAGGVYFGEDVTGQGHITRAVNNAIRFSIFAHLA